MVHYVVKGGTFCIIHVAVHSVHCDVQDMYNATGSAPGTTTGPRIRNGYWCMQLERHGATASVVTGAAARAATGAAD